jgi:hypothetical protein
MIVVMCPKCNGIDVVADCSRMILHCNECNEDFGFAKDDLLIADVREIV